MTSFLPYQPGISLAEFCRTIVQYTEHIQDPAETVKFCERQGEALRIRSQDVNAANMNLLLDTLLDVIATLENKRQEEKPPPRRSFQLKKRLRSKQFRIRRSGPAPSAQEKKHKRRAPRKVVVLLSFCLFTCCCATYS